MICLLYKKVINKMLALAIQTRLNEMLESKIFQYKCDFWKNRSVVSNKSNIDIKTASSKIFHSVSFEIFTVSQTIITI